jgi:transketolase
MGTKLAEMELSAEGVKARVVSMPSWELFDRQEPAYRESVIPSRVKARVCIEVAGPSGEIIGMRTFGASAPQKERQKKFGFVPQRIAAAAREQIAKAAPRGQKGV